MQKKVIQEIRDDYSPEKNSKRTLDGYAASIKTLADDLYAKDTHFIFELIQNAEDNSYENDTPSLRFILTKADPAVGESDTTVLIVENNETGFQAEHVEAICSVGRSTKKKEQGYIGEKGIGFKSVFKATSCPYIYSNGFQFSLPEKDLVSGLGYIVPSWIEAIPKGLNKELTSIYLPLDQTDFSVDKVVNSLKDIAPETVIFLKQLKTIELSVDLEEQYEIIIEKDDSELPLVKLTYLIKNAKKESVTEQHFWVSSKSFDKPDDIEHEKRAGITTRDVSVAIPLEQKQQGKLFAYLPVWEDTGLPFLINADFLLTSSREAVKEDEPWNDWLRGCIAEVYVDALTSCLDSDALTFKQKISSYASLPQQTKHHFLQPVISAIQEKLKSSACIYTAQCDELAVPDITRIAPKEFWNLIGDGDLPEALKDSTQLVCSELAPYSKNLRTIGASSLTNDDILECLDDDYWLALKSDDKWLLQLYRFLEDREFGCSLFEKKLVKIWDEETQQSVLATGDDGTIYFERDEEFRKALKAVPGWLDNIVPTVFLDKSFLKVVNNQENSAEIKAWMSDAFEVSTLAMASYCDAIQGVLRDQYERLSSKKIATATSFLTRHTDDDFNWNHMPVALSNGSKDLLFRFNENIIVPERYNRGKGWQHIWVVEDDRRHFHILSNHYNEETVNYLLSHCEKIRPYPDPERVERITHDLLNSYESRCYSKTSYSTRVKTVSNWRPPSVLKKEVIEDIKISESLLSFLSDICAIEETGNSFLDAIVKKNQFDNYKTAYVHWFYRTAKRTVYYSEFYARIRHCKWLPTQKGFVKPGQAFLPKKEIKEILGDTVPYAPETIPPHVVESLGIKTELTIEELLETLAVNSDETAIDIEMVYRIYLTLNTRTSFDNTEDVILAFKNKKIIFVPEGNSEGYWYSLEQVIWEDSKNVLGDDFVYLEKYYPKLKDFFIDTLGVKENADPETFAQRWLKIQHDTEKAPQEIRDTIASIYRILLPIAKKSYGERPQWWSGFVRNALVFSQGGEFLDSGEIVVPDDGELKKIFSFEGSEVAFAWRPEKDSFNQWAPFYKAFSISNISNAVTTELAQDSEFEVSAQNAFLTDSTILMLSSWLREKDNKYYEKLFEDGVFQDLYNLREATTNEAIKVLFTLETDNIYEEVAENYPVFWDQQRKILLINKQCKRSEIKRKVSTEIAKGLMGNRGYKDLSHWIELTLCAETPERIVGEGWSIPKEVKNIFKTSAQFPKDQKSKEEDITNKREDEVIQPKAKTGGDASGESKHQDTDIPRKNSPSPKNPIKDNEKQDGNNSVNEKEDVRDVNTEESQSDQVSEEKKERDDSIHVDEDAHEEEVLEHDILEKFERAFNRDGETSLSEEYEDDEYYNDGTVKNTTRRRERSKAGHRERIKNEPAQDERRRETTRTILEPADPATRSYLLNMYTGKCQICGNTFPQRSGSPFFVVGHIVERKNARLLDDPANALCLCPEHFAQWRHGKVEADDIIGQILSKRTKSEGVDNDLSLEISLCGKDCGIKYKEKHIIDLQAFLDTISEI